MGIAILSSIVHTIDMNTTEGSTIKINGRDHVVTSLCPFDGPRSSEYMLDRGIAALATVRLARTGRVDKMAYIGADGQFAGWMNV